MDNEFGIRLKQRRLELNLNQETLAAASHLTTGAISQFENGIRLPAYETIKDLAAALRITVDYLIGKKERGLEDLLADPHIAEMLDGVPSLSEEQKQQLYEVYQFLRLRSQDERRETRPTVALRASDSGVGSDLLSLTKLSHIFSNRSSSISAT